MSPTKPLFKEGDKVTVHSTCHTKGTKMVSVTDNMREMVGGEYTVHKLSWQENKGNGLCWWQYFVGDIVYKERMRNGDLYPSYDNCWWFAEGDFVPFIRIEEFKI